MNTEQRKAMGIPTDEEMIERVQRIGVRTMTTETSKGPWRFEPAGLIFDADDNIIICGENAHGEDELVEVSQ